MSEDARIEQIVKLWGRSSRVVRTADSQCQIRKSPEAVFVNLLRRPGIDSSEPIPGLLKRLQIRALGSIPASSDTMESVKKIEPRSAAVTASIEC
jgi:hypothetical protein